MKRSNVHPYFYSVFVVLMAVIIIAVMLVLGLYTNIHKKRKEVTIYILHAVMYHHYDTIYSARHLRLHYGCALKVYIILKMCMHAIA